MQWAENVVSEDLNVGPDSVNYLFDDSGQTVCKSWLAFVSENYGKLHKWKHLINI